MSLGLFLFCFTTQGVEAQKTEVTCPNDPIANEWQTWDANWGLSDYKTYVLNQYMYKIEVSEGIHEDRSLSLEWSHGAKFGFS